MFHACDARTGRGSARAIAICLVAVAFVLGVFPIDERTASAQQKERRAAASWIEHFMAQRDGLVVEAPSIATTRNFAVYYSPSHFADTGRIDRLPGSQLLPGNRIPDYIGLVMGELEFAYQRLVDLGFPVPGSARSFLITVFVASPEKIDAVMDKAIMPFTNPKGDRARVVASV